MKKLLIKQAEQKWWEPVGQSISVVVNGLCNHADYRVEDEEDVDEYQEGVTGRAQPVYRYKVVVCNRCDAWKYTDGIVVEGWHNEHFEDDDE